MIARVKQVGGKSHAKTFSFQVISNVSRAAKCDKGCQLKQSQNNAP